MEKSIKRVEKLVHVTNSALAQMKFSLMFDDLSGDPNGEFGGVKPFDPTWGKKLIDGDDLKHCQSEFKSEANEMLEKMESMFGRKEPARKNSKAVERIKEINRQMNRLEQPKLEETEQSRRKLLNLLNEEKFSSGVTSSWESGQSKQKKESSEMPPSAVPKRTDSLLTVAKSKSREELKSKILETQDIVNRGFQTARQLAQKVETLSKHERKEKTPSTNVSEINLRSTDGKTESNESVSTVKCRKCARRSRKRREAEEAVQVNARIIDVERKEVQRCRRSNLQMQRLPSLHIRGSLQLQKVHNLEIPAGGDGSHVKSNTAVNFLSHEQMQNEKLGEAIEKARKENCCCTAGNPQGTYVECFNCGKLIRVRETRVDPRKVDEILQKCNFDVFDPRIDEFVEKCGTSPNWCDKPQTPAATAMVEPEVTTKKTRGNERGEQPKKNCPNLQGLSEQVLKKYKRHAETMESNHLKLENILQNLFRQIDESREVFEKCHLFKNTKSEGETPPKLTATKPVVVNLTGSSFRGRTKQRTLNKQKANDVSANRTELEKNKPTDKRRVSLIYVNPEGNSKAEETPERRSVSSSGSEKQEDAASTGTSSSASSNHFGRGVTRTPGMQRRRTKAFREEEPEGKSHGRSSPNKTIIPPETTERRVGDEKLLSKSSSSSSSRSRQTGQSGQSAKTPFREEETERKPQSSDESENNYESDFESMTNEPNENADEEGEPEPNAEGNKLSTISEVDSELEKKVSDEQKTGRNDASEMEDAHKRHRDIAPTEQKTETSPKDKKTEVTSPKTAETCSKSTPSELVTSLKDILTALQDQFVRTESLAEKLTENVRAEGLGKPEPGVSLLGNTWNRATDAGLVENLRSARKDLPKSPRRSEKSASERSKKSALFSADSLSDEGGSSLGEIIVSDRRRKPSGSSSISECSYLRMDSVRKSARVASNRREASANSPFKLDVNSEEEVLYSEGEIPSDEVFALERFRTNSLGEIVSGKNSTASTL